MIDFYKMSIPYTDRTWKVAVGARMRRCKNVLRFLFRACFYVLTFFKNFYNVFYFKNVGNGIHTNSKLKSFFFWFNVHCESKKQGTTILSISSPNVGRFSNFFTDRFTSKYATKSSLTIPPHLKGVAELPCETSVSENSENLMHASLSTTNHKVV